MVAKKIVKKVGFKGHLQNVKVKLKEAQVKVHNAMKKNPEKAALIAAGVGVAIGAAVTAIIMRHKKK
ncbi:MAG: hypothetical protein AABX04_00235 [Nanoarchaeota archaeon]|mgnify:CR=1 FL=1